jgi:hypothetical protein
MGGYHAQDFHPFRSSVRVGDGGYRDGRDDRRDLGYSHGTRDPVNVVPYLTAYLVAGIQSSANDPNSARPEHLARRFSPYTQPESNEKPQPEGTRAKLG